MMRQYDVIIRGGTVVDGTGRHPFDGDVAISAGRIAAVGKIAGSAAEELDARGRIVTPGFIDIHTHYDGHAVWSERLNPSSLHGVTTAITGNCGVGFAPCKPHDRERLVSLMEGIEDIPEIVLTDGLTWDWESFPDFLDVLASRRFDMDVAAYLPHAPLRVFVMGERAAAREPASAEDIEQMRRIVSGAISAGAMGFATSRTLNHRSREGWLTPSYAAGEDELLGIAEAMRVCGSGAIQLISDFDNVDVEFNMLERVVAASSRPGMVTLLQQAHVPDRWRAILDRIEQANARGVPIKAQIGPRPIGALLGLELILNPFSNCPSYAAVAGLPFKQRLAALRATDLRERLIAEQPGSISGMRAGSWHFENLFPMSDPPCYEPKPEESIAARAAAMDMNPVDYAYDLLIADGGKGIIFMPASNYVDGSVAAVETMLGSKHTLIGLGDGGAHCSTICDSSFPTYLLARWVGNGSCRMPVERAVQMLTADNAFVMGLRDRGTIKVGQRADLNIIDLDHLQLRIPEIVYDLPLGRGRLEQRAVGYDATIVAGTLTYRGGEPTGALPGRLVRSKAA
jgi:N-acyl-D-aspartate/D-glutamate deacylase